MICFFNWFLKEKKGERNILWLPPMRPNQGLNHYLGVCPVRESNLQPFDVWDYAPTTPGTGSQGHRIIWKYFISPTRPAGTSDGVCVWHTELVARATESSLEAFHFPHSACGDRWWCVCNTLSWKWKALLLSQVPRSLCIWIFLCKCHTRAHCKVMFLR